MPMIDSVRSSERVRLADGRVYLVPSGRLCMWCRARRGDAAPWLEFRYVDGGGFYLSRANLHLMREAAQ